MDEVTLELLDAKIDELKAMLIEILTWKEELGEAMQEVSKGGILSMFSNMFSNNG